MSLRSTFPLIPFFLQQTRQASALLRHEFPVMSYLHSPAPYLKFSLHLSRMVGVTLATCPSFTLRSQSTPSAVDFVLLNSSLSCTLLSVSTIRLAHVSCLGQCRSLIVGVFLTSTSFQFSNQSDIAKMHF